MTKQSPKGGGVAGAQQKLRAQDRRDQELIDFCGAMVKELLDGEPSVSDRRDAAYWRSLAEHIATTDNAGQPLGPRKPVPTTARLAWLHRGGEFVQRLQAIEVSQLRAEGVSWQMIGDAVAMTREGARRRWSE